MMRTKITGRLSYPMKEMIMKYPKRANQKMRAQDIADSPK
jgi:hypothetical protein